MERDNRSVSPPARALVSIAIQLSATHPLTNAFHLLKRWFRVTWFLPTEQRTENQLLLDTEKRCLLFYSLTLIFPWFRRPGLLSFIMLTTKLLSTHNHLIKNNMVDICVMELITLGNVMFVPQVVCVCVCVCVCCKRWLVRLLWLGVCRVVIAVNRAGWRLRVLLCSVCYFLLSNTCACHMDIN